MAQSAKQFESVEGLDEPEFIPHLLKASDIQVMQGMTQVGIPII